MKSKFIKIPVVMVFFFIYSDSFSQDTTQFNTQQNSRRIQTTDNREVKFLASEEDKQVVAQAISNLEFDFDKATIKPSFYPNLKVLAGWLKERNFTLKISGYADYIGPKDYNLDLSRERAEAVKEYLSREGADPNLMDLVGYGEKIPIASNDTSEGRQKNRRVEFSLY